MSALALLALLGFAVFIPILLDDDDEDTEQPDPQVVNGTQGDDTLTGAGDNSALNGGNGDDRLEFVSNDGRVNGGNGADTIAVDGARNTALGGTGADTLDVSGEAHTVEGGRGNDVINLRGTNNTAEGNRGGDIFLVRGSGHLVNGGDGTDSFNVETDNATINGGRGDDDLFITESSNTVANGGVGDDILSGAGDAITLNGNAGNDFIQYLARSGSAHGGDGDDTIDAANFGTGLGGSLFGEEGDDVLSVENGGVGRTAMLLDGGEGDDNLSTTSNVREGTFADTLTGGAGADQFTVSMRFEDTPVTAPQDGIVTITDFDRAEDILRIDLTTRDSGTLLQGITFSPAADGSYTDVVTTFVSGADGPSATTIRVQGVADLTRADVELTANDFFVDVGDENQAGVGTAGNDTLSSAGSLFQVNTLEDLAGDDLLIHTAADSSGQLILRGGDGDDTLIANEVAFGNQTTLDGGAGDDVLRSDNFLPRNASGDTFDTFITGARADRIEITTFNTGSSDSIALGLIGLVTDFTPGEDMIFVDPSQVIREIVAIEDNEEEIDFNAAFTNAFELREDPAGAFTDLDFTFTAIATGDQMTGGIRLEGLTDLAPEDIAFAQLDSAAPIFTREGVIAGI